jgi:hypothetical protein
VSVPLVPVYPFNKPGQAIQLYRGGIGGLGAGDVTGSVEFRCTPDPSVAWSVDPGSPPDFANRRDEMPMVLHRPDGTWSFLAMFSGSIVDGRMEHRLAATRYP